MTLYNLLPRLVCCLGCFLLVQLGCKLFFIIVEGVQAPEEVVLVAVLQSWRLE